MPSAPPPIRTDEDVAFYDGVQLSERELRDVRFIGWNESVRRLGLLLSHPRALAELNAEQQRVLRYIHDKRVEEQRLWEIRHQDGTTTWDRDILKQRARIERSAPPSALPVLHSAATAERYARVAQRRVSQALVRELLATTRQLREMFAA